VSDASYPATTDGFFAIAKRKVMEGNVRRTNWGKAGLLYFGVVFGVGFALGVIRTLWIVPEVGVRAAELIEMPFMIVVTIIVCRLVMRRFAVPPSLWPRLAMGLVGLAMLIGAELVLGSLLFGRTFFQYITSRDPVSGAAYFLALGMFGAMPFLIGRRVNPNGVSLIDAFMDKPDVSESHETVVHAPADVVLDVAENLDLLSIPAINAIFRLRERLFGLESKPRSGPRGLVAETTALGWGVLAHRHGREIVMGAVTQPWIGEVKFRPVPPAKFRSFSEPEFVKIAWTLEAEPIGPAETRFRTQTRVLATDRHARRKFRIYWTFAGFFIVLIRIIGNRAIRREAERRVRDSEGDALREGDHDSGMAGSS
jgi:hypothetical protein